MLPIRTRNPNSAVAAPSYTPDYQMSLERQPYEEHCSNIRARPIAWNSYQRTGIITPDEVERIKAIDKVNLETRVKLVIQDSDGYAKLFLGDGGAEKGILGRIGASREGGDIIQYILVLMGDLLENKDIPQFATSLLAVPKAFTHLLPLLSHPDVTVPVFTSRVLTIIFSVALNAVDGVPSEHIQTALPTYLSYLATLIKSNDTYLQDVSVQSYVSLLQSSFARITFWNSGAEGLEPLITILQAAARGSANGGGVSSGSTPLSGMIQGGVGLQLLYHVLLVVWELTFEETVAEEIHEKYDLIPTLTLIIRSALKEKIARVSTAILYNLAKKAPTSNLSPLLVSNCLPLLQSTSQRFTSDPDLTEDLTYLIETLESYQRSQTTFDEYAAEVRSGHLRWSPPHKNTDFWKKNARRIVEEGNGELMKALARALSGGTAASSPDAKIVLAVAAHDVGVLVREVPEKRKVWEQLGVKSKVMQLIGDSDASVRYEALTAVRGFLEHAFSS